MHQPIQKPRQATNKKILLGDTNASSQENNKFLLQQAGYQVDLAENGQDILLKLTGGDRYDAILVKADLDDMTALQLTSHMHQQQREKNKLVVLTQSNLPYDKVLELSSMGVSDVISELWFAQYIGELFDE